MKAPLSGRVGNYDAAMSAIEMRASRAFRNSEPGFYVINGETEIAVSGPHAFESEAWRDCERRNDMYPDDEFKLGVWQIPDLAESELIELS
jgi:hypothetical protein